MSNHIFSLLPTLVPVFLYPVLGFIYMMHYLLDLVYHPDALLFSFMIKTLIHPWWLLVLKNFSFSVKFFSGMNGNTRLGVFGGLVSRTIIKMHNFVTLATLEKHQHDVSKAFHCLFSRKSKDTRHGLQETMNVHNSLFRFFIILFDDSILRACHERIKFLACVSPVDF